jgi:hypothetical protein
LGTCFAAGLFLERVVIVSKFQMKKIGRDGKKSKRGSGKKINDGSGRQNSERYGVMTVTDDNNGAGRFTNGQCVQAGVRAIDRALARHKNTVGTVKNRDGAS